MSPDFTTELKATEQGDANSQVIVGCLYRDGGGVARNIAEAMKWWHKAAEQGNAEAQLYLGVMYAGDLASFTGAVGGGDDGEDVAADHIEAVKWYRLWERRCRCSTSCRDCAALRQVPAQRLYATTSLLRLSLWERLCRGGTCRRDRTALRRLPAQLAETTLEPMLTSLAAFLPKPERSQRSSQPGPDSRVAIEVQPDSRECECYSFLGEQNRPASGVER